MYNYYQQQPAMRQTVVPMILKGHPVSSLEEARASSIEFDGSISYFPDIANKRIYTKQINVTDGTSILNMYELTPLPQEPVPVDTQNFITRTEFNSALEKINQLLESKKIDNKQYKEAF